MGKIEQGRCTCSAGAAPAGTRKIKNREMDVAYVLCFLSVRAVKWVVLAQLRQRNNYSGVTHAHAVWSENENPKEWWVLLVFLALLPRGRDQRQSCTRENKSSTDLRDDFRVEPCSIDPDMMTR